MQEDPQKRGPLGKPTTTTTTTTTGKQKHKDNDKNKPFREEKGQSRPSEGWKNEPARHQQPEGWRNEPARHQQPDKKTVLKSVQRSRWTEDIRMPTGIRNRSDLEEKPRAPATTTQATIPRVPHGGSRKSGSRRRRE